MVPLPVFQTAAFTPIESPPMSTSFSLTVNQPFTLESGANVIGSLWWAVVAPPIAKLPPPMRKQSENARCLILPAPCSLGTSVPVLDDMPMIPSAFCVRKSPVS